MSPSEWVWLLGVVSVAFVVEAVTGFGATVFAVALGSAVLPMAELLPAFVPVNLILSVIVAFRDRAHVDVRLLGTRVLPAMLMGMPVGLWVFGLLGAQQGRAEAAFGLFVVTMAALRLRAMRRAHVSPPLAPALALATLGAAGVVHGAFGTGGPLVILVLGRLGLDKARFRATLACLWMVLSVPLLLGFATQGRFGAESVHRSLALLPALLLGLGVGQALHRRLRPDSFLVAVYALLAFAGLFLVTRGLFSA